MLFQNMERIVFAGDSVTDMGRATPVGEGLFDNVGRSYVRILENELAVHYPERALRITNAGRSGDTSRDLLARWEEDVLALHPDHVSICIGVNDVWRQFDSPAIAEHAVYPEEYERNLRQMIQSLSGKVKTVFLLSPYYMEPNTADPMRAKMDEYRGIAKRLAEENGCRYVDLQEMFDRYFRYHHSSYLAWDRVHPNQIGATLIANEFLKHCEFDYYHDPQKEEDKK